jgi:hypothetical protein
MTLKVFMGVSCPDLFLVPVSTAHEWWYPAELMLAAQCLRWVSVKGPHEECGFRLTCTFKRLLLNEGGERGTILSHGLHKIADAIVPDGWHKTIAALGEFTGIFLPQSQENG